MYLISSLIVMSSRGLTTGSSVLGARVLDPAIKSRDDEWD